MSSISKRIKVLSLVVLVVLVATISVVLIDVLVTKLSENILGNPKDSVVIYSYEGTTTTTTTTTTTDEDVTTTYSSEYSVPDSITEDSSYIEYMIHLPTGEMHPVIRYREGNKDLLHDLSLGTSEWIQYYR